MRALRATLLLVALAAIGPMPATAEPPAPRTASQEEKKVLRPGEVEVRGKARRPSAPPITPPNLDTRPPESRKSFLPRVVEALDRDPFQERRGK
jgi:hypothetical protein